ncbi:MAG TPA: YciI family protein [Chloroflexota bacterium]|nr:YciI family protein [Chloroflexota bacterium]
MRYMAIVKATEESESGRMPTEAELAEMGRFNEELVKAGVMLEGAGLLSSSRGARIQYSGSNRTVVDGPFTEAKELVAGYWIWQVRSHDEAIEWAKRIPFQAGEVELRRVAEAEDFGESFTPELQEQEARLWAQAAEQAKQ